MGNTHLKNKAIQLKNLMFKQPFFDVKYLYRMKERLSKRFWA